VSGRALALARSSYARVRTTVAEMKVEVAMKTWAVRVRNNIRRLVPNTTRAFFLRVIAPGTMNKIQRLQSTLAIAQKQRTNARKEKSEIEKQLIVTEEDLVRTASDLAAAQVSIKSIKLQQHKASTILHRIDYVDPVNYNEALSDAGLSWNLRGPLLGIELIKTLISDGDLPRCLAHIARVIPTREGLQLAYRISCIDGLVNVSGLIRGVIAKRLGLWQLAYSELSKLPKDVLVLALEEYCEAGMHINPLSTTDAVLDIVTNDSCSKIDSATLVDILEILVCFKECEAASSLDAIISERLADPLPPALVIRYDNVRCFLYKLKHPVCKLESLDANPDALKAPAVNFGVFTYKNPDYKYASNNMGDYVQTLGGLAHLLRHKDIELIGSNHSLVKTAYFLQSRIAENAKVETGEGTVAKVRLVEIDRDASTYDDIPPETWLLSFGWFAQPRRTAPVDFPFHANINPLFISFHVDRPDMLTAVAIDYLRKYSPIGCRDWATTYMLLSCGVPAFFSGCITTNVNLYFPDFNRESNRKELAFVDYPKDAEDRDYFEQGTELIRKQPLAWNLRNAMDTLEQLSGYETLVTSRLHCYLPLSSIGVNVDFPKQYSSDSRFDGLRDVGIDGAKKMGRDLIKLLSPVMSLILNHSLKADIYTAWRSAAQPLVDSARRRLTSPFSEESINRIFAEKEGSL